jgi:hypothetical protein
MQVLSPRMEHGEEADLCSQVLRVRGDGRQGFGRGAEQDVVDHSLVLVRNGGDLFRDGEHDVKIRNVEKLRIPVLDPSRAGKRLAFWAVAIAAAVVAVPLVAARIAPHRSR